MADDKIVAEGQQDANEEVVDDLADLDVVEVDAQGKPVVAVATDERLGTEGQQRDEEELDEKRTRRREERHRRRQNQRQQIDAGKQAMAENARLRERLEQLEQTVGSRFTDVERQTRGVGIALLDRRIQDAERVITDMNNVLVAARTAKNQADEAQAQTIKDEAQEQLRNLKHLRQQAEVDDGGDRRAPPETRRDGGRPATPPPVPREVVENAAAFSRDNPWYNPDVRVVDRDSMVARAVELDLVNKGSDPRTPEHWEELEDILAEMLPHRYNGRGGDSGQTSTDRSDTTARRQATDNSRERGKPPVGTGRDQGASSNGKRIVRISPERKAAMIEAGYWDDPQKRAKMIREYDKWDRDNAPARQ